MTRRKIICFGEVLWDLLPSGKVAGGAPMNVAYHLQNLGGTASVISQVGADRLGRELLDFQKRSGIDVGYITTDLRFPTGTVNVQIDEKGFPAYEIVMPVAWDYIPMDNEKLDAVKEADALVFGSLACRSERSRQTLLELAQAASFRVLDVNLRPPFFSRQIVEPLLTLADMLKLNDEELAIISAWYGKDLDELKAMEFLKENFGLETIILTKGKEGAICMHDQKLYSHSGFSVTVEDTVGSGDSFLAAFLKKMFDWSGTQYCLDFACAMGALVATHKGGTPRIEEKMVLRFLDTRKSVPTNH